MYYIKWSITDLTITFWHLINLSDCLVLSKYTCREGKKTFDQPINIFFWDLLKQNRVWQILPMFSQSRCPSLHVWDVCSALLKNAECLSGRSDFSNAVFTLGSNESAEHWGWVMTQMNNLLIEISWIMERIMISAESHEAENLGFVSKTQLLR